MDDIYKIIICISLFGSLVASIIEFDYYYAIYTLPKEYIIEHNENTGMYRWKNGDAYGVSPCHTFGQAVKNAKANKKEIEEIKRKENPVWVQVAPEIEKVEK